MAERYPRPYRGGGGRGRWGRGRSSSRDRRDRAGDADRANERRMYHQQPDRVQILQPLLPVDDNPYGRGRAGDVDRSNEIRVNQQPTGQRGRRGGPSQSHSRQRPSYSDGWRREKIDELALRGPDEIVGELYEGQSKLKAYVGKWQIRHPKELSNLSHVLDKLIRSEKQELSNPLLAIFFDPDSSSSFWGHVMSLVKKMPNEQSVDYRNKNREVLKRLCRVFACALERIPQTCALSISVPDVVFTIGILAMQDQGTYSNLRELADGLNQSHQVVMQEFLAKPHQQPHSLSKKQLEEEKGNHHNQPLPFGDFRRVVILPSVEEMERDQGLKLQQRAVRSNLVKGSYIDWNHYLDVHFRLLREDFVCPLREGLSLHLEGQRKRNTNIRVYTGVRILEPVCLFSEIGFQIKFDVTRFHRVNWDHSKRLIFGSLLCLSSDDFKNIHFATVVQRTSNQLAKGIVTIKFEDNTDGFRLDTSTDFTMIESSAYFEAYRHVLKRLQEINTDFMPFKEYLVESKTSKVVAPLYLQTSSNKNFDLHGVLGISQNSITGRCVSVLDKYSWPACQSTCFDASQLKAMQMALTQSISVIQGPPGTGKTYVGVRIVEALLNNSEKWRKGVTNPILVVCYTNHALDQFLEYIHALKSQPKIVRIGGRARSEEMKACSLRNLVQERKAAKAVPHSIFKQMQVIRKQLLRMKEELEKRTLSVSAQEDKVLLYTELSPYIDPKFRYQLDDQMTQWNDRDAGKELEIWLELWFPTPVNPPEAPDPDVLAAEMEQVSIQGHGIPLENVDEVEDGEVDLEEGVDVDEEARLAEDERMMEGEDILLQDEDAPPPRVTVEEVPKPPVRKPGKYDWQIEQLSQKKKKNEIAKGLSEIAMTQQKVRQVNDIFTLNKKQKWQLYQYWAQEFIRRRKSQAQRFAEDYQTLGKELNKIQEDMDLSVLNSADIIGMTTTGAAKHSYILEKLVPKIVVIEEAAEVLESHIVSCLSSGAQQLILIGDHKQLRPKPTTYELVQHCHMDVSLFERLANNNYPHTTLQIQHRMEPEIRKLVHPHIYKTLEDHDTVSCYPKISGVGKHLFFIDHSSYEDPNEDQDLLSHSNKFEVDYIVGLCRYLLKQGYKPEQITILTMYKGQLLKFKKRMPRAEFGGVRVAAVDDFQGEENDIILLSLVRSNSDGNIGFLRDKNRVCVSLSRAKWGLYVIGNFQMLRTKDDTIWPNIIEDVEKRNFLGQALPLYCCNHPQTRTIILSASDFAKVPEGGCSKPCGVRLSCGHSCRRTCHVQDREHKIVKCMRDCQKTLICGHQCSKRCYECAGGCPPCKVKVTRTLLCGHTMVLTCGASITTVKCMQPCKKVLPRCGHPCMKMCYEPCPAKCETLVEKRLSCGHNRALQCSVEPRDAKCLEPCKQVLECGHPCTGTCSGCVQGRLHQPCSEDCGRTLACGHICTFPCTNKCPPCEKACNNYCNHSRCPKKCKEPCQPCMEACQWACPHHMCTRKCGEQCDRPRCDKPCRKKLKCKHPCIGLCGEECPTLCCVCNKDKVTEIFFGDEDEPDARFVRLKDCGHIFEVKGLDQWMDQESVGDDTKSREIQFKQCPKCKVPVRRSLRYGNVIKRTLSDMERVKAAVFRGAEGGSVDLNALVTDMRTLRTKLRSKRHYSILSSQLEAVKEEMKKAKSLAYHEKMAYQTKCSVINSCGSLIEKMAELRGTSIVAVENTPLKCEEIFKEMTVVLKYTCEQRYFASQQTSDIETEMKRLSLLVSWCEIAHKVGLDQAGQLTSNDKQQLVKLLQYCRLAGLEGKADKLSDTYYSKIKAALDTMRKKCGGLGISSDERLMIVKAMGLTQGHWYKCPNGHVYCITECGGASEESVCPECKAKIGGTSHRLRDDNRVATEMDGARHPAFSQEANEEYFRELQRRFGIR